MTYVYYIDQIKDVSGWLDGNSGVTLQWTTEPPTREGWYWVSFPTSGEVIVRVGFDADNKPFDAENIDDPYLLGNVTHWLGPLPVPEPPREGE